MRRLSVQTVVVMSDDIQTMLDVLQQIKDNKPESADEAECRHSTTRKVVVETGQANRTKNRYVGGVDMQVITECRNCGKRVGGDSDE